ncbi:hypothetical protein CK203_037006 [Vitis vinifera]|uniref:Uncharacterized protein n=1 Tax=Vitis vinifera TaxID=29760 RepID=A0A438IUU0_VITVI|nr:hypothetical protein CK203_037006 [Vitis vinifera]
MEIVHIKTLLEKSKFERELKILECSINYEGRKKQNGGEQESEGGSFLSSGDQNLDNVGGVGEKFGFWFRNVEYGLTWIFTGVYGPFSKEDKDCMWEELGAIKGLWDDPWCLGVTSMSSCPKGKGVVRKG